MAGEGADIEDGGLEVPEHHRGALESCHRLGQAGYHGRGDPVGLDQIAGRGQRETVRHAEGEGAEAVPGGGALGRRGTGRQDQRQERREVPAGGPNGSDLTGWPALRY